MISKAKWATESKQRRPFFAYIDPLVIDVPRYTMTAFRASKIYSQP